MRAVEFITEAEFDPRGWGETPRSTDVDYFGLRVTMSPRMFLMLANPLTPGAENPDIAKHMQAGGKIAYPFLEINDPPEWEEGDFRRPARVVSHEGRNRITQWIKMKGDQPIQVNLFLRNANRRRYISDEMIKELSQGMISEWGQFIRNPFDASTALEEDWKSKLATGATAAALALSGGQVAQSPGLPQSIQSQYKMMSPADILSTVAKSAGIAGNELTQLLAQTAHETMNFTHMVERGSPDYFKRKYENPRTAKKLGNKFAGDGERYKGRGFIQLTGRDNYMRAGKAMGMMFVNPYQPNDPKFQAAELEAARNRKQLETDPWLSSKVTIWYWKNRVASRVDDFTDTRAVTKKINPGLKHLDRRHQQFQKQQAAK